jgi:hypothetical protein
MRLVSLVITWGSIAYQNSLRVKATITNRLCSLKKMLEDWKSNYLIISPMGKVSFFNPINLYQSVGSDKEIISVIPLKKKYHYAYKNSKQHLKAKK